ncbi:MAG: helix-turn-helix domain-containing protein [Nitriliruptor sp.]|uniref:helix-turn-helix domain-containing protein n=1 Tax=Nitriliruptor sp. TaxID=2448056 RepID=UPI0034A07DA9
MRDQTTKQIADALGLAPSTVQKYARDGHVLHDMTPGGHRRFNLEEVRAALFEEASSLRRPALALDGGLGTGEAVTFSEAAAAERDIRALVALPEQGPSPERTALEDLFGTARRVLVSTAG